MINLLANPVIFGHDNSMKIFKLIAMPTVMAISACSVPEAKVQPNIVDAPKPAAQPASQPATATITQPKGDWIDWPISAGDWVYRQDARGSIALFGAAGQDAMLTIRCMANSKQIFLSRAGNAANGGQFTIRTSHTLKSFAASGNGATSAYAVASIGANDAILDALTYTRGRFAIEVDGLQSLAIPSWSELARVVQDCR